MADDIQVPNVGFHRKWYFWVLIFLALLALVFLLTPKTAGNIVEEKFLAVSEFFQREEVIPKYPPLDTADYDKRIYALVGKEPPQTQIEEVEVLEGEVSSEQNINKKPSPWPVVTEYPRDGAILPFHRVVAYYGNLYSKQMGALGEYPEEEMLTRLMSEVDAWNQADPETPVVPALHYIVSVAQASSGRDGMYRFVMPDKEIEKVLAMAKKINGIVFLDIQVGLSNIETELPKYEKYLKLENVHLGIDPEFYMKTGARPGTVIGSMDAKDINFATAYLARVVKENNLSPKILVIHRFTQRMVMKYFEIAKVPEVQIVMNMDGWGGKAHKINTYRQYIYREPVQFTGFKIFYKNDTKEPNTTIFTPEELLKLTPQPVYIQYQ